MEAPKARTDEIVRGISGQFNASTEERHYANEVQFSFHNHREIMNLFEEGRAVDMVDIPKQKRKSVLIIGSGPNLDLALPRIKEWEGDIICSTSHAATLIGWGREPEHIVALDPDSSPAELEADTWEGRKSILYVHPGVMPDLIRWWPGKMAFFRKLQPQQGFYGSEQMVGYSPLGPVKDRRYQGNESKTLITSQVPMLACAMAAQVCIAKHLGYRQQVFVGGDFLAGRFTARRWTDGQWVDDPPYVINYEQKEDPVVETEIDGKESTAVQIFYGHQTVVAWRLTECDIVNAFPDGLLRCLPYRPWEKVLKQGNRPERGLTLTQIRRISEEHLARQNIFILNVKNGIMPHEFKDPLHEIPKALGQIKATLTAQGDPDGVDVEANMKRIKRLVAKVFDAGESPQFVSVVRDEVI